MCITGVDSCTKSCGNQLLITSKTYFRKSPYSTVFQYIQTSDTTPKIHINVRHNNGSHLKVCNYCICWRRHVTVIRTFHTVTLVCCVFSQSHILRTSLVKSHNTGKGNSPVIHRSDVTTTLSVVRRAGFYRHCVMHTWKRSAVHQAQKLCFKLHTRAVKRYYAERDKFTVQVSHPMQWSSWKPEKLGAH